MTVSMGDHILKTVAQSIQSILPDNAGLFKLDNDCMGILMDNVGHRDMETLYMEIRNMMGRMHFWNQYKLNLTLSAGGVMYPEDGGAASELFKYAEYSLRYAKEKGRDRIVFFSKEILENQKKTLKIMMALRSPSTADSPDSACVISPRWTRPAERSSVPRLCCAGRIRTAVLCPRWSLSPFWRRRE